MTDRSKTLEVMARGIAKVYGGVISPDGLNMIADLALTAYESHLQVEGMAVVPVKPTDDMLNAGFQAGWRWREACRVVAVVSDAWPAMVAASPYGKAVVKEEQARLDGLAPSSPGNGGADQ